MPEEKNKPKIEDLQKKIEELEKQKTENLAGWQRARADFLNYKKEEMERIEQFLKYGEEEFILKILPILDNFDLAEKKLTEEMRNDESVKGFLQIKAQILDFLKSHGVEEMKVMGEKFDPNFHEAVELIAEQNKESGSIIEETQKGYKINGRLLRPARVKVVK
ncbi:MAG TPA: nucleotide exchange factor GrpE [Candidatus Humimicrobiaceae bacterium]|nr:nucleotide exchange factor GrpE [Candidatus Humimicrobiaceae bacterium]